MSAPKNNEKEAKQISGYTAKDIETRVVKSFLDILILIEMKKEQDNHLSGYDITAFVNNRFGGILSPGTVYATLYSMERKGLITGLSDGRKTVYALTERGKEVVSVMMQNFHKEMAEFAGKFLKFE